MKKLQIKFTKRNATEYSGAVYHTDGKECCVFSFNKKGSKTYWFPQTLEGSGLDNQQNSDLQIQLAAMADEYFGRDFFWVGK